MEPIQWLQFVKQKGIPAGLIVLVIAGSVFVAKVWTTQSIQHDFDQKLESHKEQLRAQNAVELEKLKAGLEKTALEHQTRFERHYADVTDAITLMFGKLARVEYTCESFVYAQSLTIPNSDDTSTTVAIPSSLYEKEAKATREALDDFKACYFEHSLFLTQDLCDTIEKFIDLVDHVLFMPTLDQLSEEVEELIEEQDIQLEREPVAARQIFEQRIHPAKEDIRLQFRELLGVIEARRFTLHADVPPDLSEHRERLKKILGEQ